MEELNDSLRKLLEVLKETNEVYDKFVRQASETIEEVRRLREGRSLHADDSQSNEDGGAQPSSGEERADGGSLSEVDVPRDAKESYPLHPEF